jgi:hypothetical protein
MIVMADGVSSITLILKVQSWYPYEEIGYHYKFLLNFIRSFTQMPRQEIKKSTTIPSTLFQIPYASPALPYNPVHELPVNIFRYC